MTDNRDKTLCEYSDEESAFLKGALSPETEGKHFRMELTAREYLLGDFSMYAEQIVDSMSGEEILAKVFADAERDPASEEYSMVCDAYMISDGTGRTVVRYKESLDGETEQTTEISFDADTPGLVTICKVGVGTTVLTIEEGRRHSCVYRTPFMDFDMRVRAVRAENTVTESGGMLRLDYALEIKGAAAHRTVMEITLTDV